MIVLGSSSPRRKELLAMLGLEFIVYSPNIDENFNLKDPIALSEKTALEKGKAVSLVYPNATVIAADTVVLIEDEILGKPKNKEDAFKMIKEIQGKVHYVITSVYLSKGSNYKVFSEKTKVWVSSMTDKEIEDYVSTKEPYDKAGGYAIQGLFAKYVERIDGDFYNVMGLPLNRVYNELKK